MRRALLILVTVLSQCRLTISSIAPNSLPAVPLEDGAVQFQYAGMEPPPSDKAKVLESGRPSYSQVSGNEATLNLGPPPPPPASPHPPNPEYPTKLSEEQKTALQKQFSKAILEKNVPQALYLSPLGPAPKMNMPNIAMEQMPQVSNDPDAIIRNWPFVKRKIEVPNAMKAGKEAADGVLATIKKLPQKLVGGPEEIYQTAMTIARTMMVNGNYMGLMMLQGAKPTENKEDGEYRRVTQAPMIDYKLIKRTAPDVGFNFGDILKQELGSETSKVNRLLKEEKTLRSELAEIQKKNAYFAAELVNPNTKGGDLGVGADRYRQGRVLTEKSGLLVPAIVSRNPIAWLPRGHRTFKTTYVPDELGGGLPTRNLIRGISKQSPSQLQSKTELLGPSKEIYDTQMTPRHPEFLE